MLPLKHPNVWRILGWLLIVGVVAASLGPWGFSLLGLRPNDKTLHLVVYFILAVWFAGMYRRTRYPLIAAGLLFMGGMLEVAQEFVGRHAELKDFYANAAGVAAGLLLAGTLMAGWCLRVERWLTPR